MGLEDVEAHLRSLRLLFGTETVRQAQALLDRSEKFFGLETLGPDMEGSPMHQTLLAAYDKLFVA
jgi:ribosomal protein S12 methylthiotransferase accessory factor